jgi:hypothetical protein
MQAIGSREYALMLTAAKFKDGDEKMVESARQLWAYPAAILHPHTVPLPWRNSVPGPTPGP